MLGSRGQPAAGLQAMKAVSEDYLGTLDHQPIVLHAVDQTSMLWETDDLVHTFGFSAANEGLLCPTPFPSTWSLPDVAGDVLTLPEDSPMASPSSIACLAPGPTTDTCLPSTCARHDMEVHALSLHDPQAQYGQQRTILPSPSPSSPPGHTVRALPGTACLPCRKAKAGISVGVHIVG